ncbi:hypothetical protein C8R46DRAFT_1224274 [Mycena filopes]|nr:hypothetical protein C8R46DRAFT_1224274 [Mycena filopes]
MSALRMRSITSGKKTYTLVENSPDTRHTLSIGTNASLSTPEFIVALPHITLPKLTAVNIGQFADVYTDQMTEFLRRHRSHLTQIIHRGTQVQVPPVFTATWRFPDDAQNNEPFLPFLKNLTLEFKVEDYRSGNHGDLLHELSLISPGCQVALVFFMTESLMRFLWKHCWGSPTSGTPAPEEAAALGRTLSHVRSLHLCNTEITHGQSLLSWFKKLPNLKEIVLWAYSAPLKESEAWDAFIQKIRNDFPGTAVTDRTVEP